MVGYICSKIFGIFGNSGIAVLTFMFDLLFTKLSSSFSIPQNLSLSLTFLVNSLVSNLTSNTFPFVVGQNFGPFVNSDTWNLVRWGFDKVMILGCIFSRDVSLVGDPSFFVAKELYFKVYAFMTVNNENKLLCYESYLHKMGFDTLNC